MRNSLTTIMVACALALMAGPAAAQVEIPAEWEGIWETQIDLYDCDTNFLLFSTTATDTICEGDVLEQPEGEDSALDCTGSADANSYTLNCTGTEEVAPGCTATYTYVATGTRSGDSYTAEATMDITFSGDCGIPDSCQRTEITGTRISSDPGPCEQTPVESWSWNTVRSLYR